MKFIGNFDFPTNGKIILYDNIDTKYIRDWEKYFIKELCGTGNLNDIISITTQYDSIKLFCTLDLNIFNDYGPSLLGKIYVVNDDDSFNNVDLNKLEEILSKALDELKDKLNTIIMHMSSARIPQCKNIIFVNNMFYVPVDQTLTFNTFRINKPYFNVESFRLDN